MEREMIESDPPFTRGELIVMNEFLQLRIASLEQQLADAAKPGPQTIRELVDLAVAKQLADRFAARTMTIGAETIGTFVTVKGR